MPNIRCTINRTTGNIDPVYSKQDRYITLNLKAKVKVNRIMNGYANNSVTTIWDGIFVNTSVSIIRSGLVEVLLTEIKVSVVGFDHYLSTITGNSMTAIDLCNDYVISHMNKTSLL